MSDNPVWCSRCHGFYTPNTGRDGALCPRCVDTWTWHDRTDLWYGYWLCGGAHELPLIPSELARRLLRRTR